MIVVIYEFVGHPLVLQERSSFSDSGRVNLFNRSGKPVPILFTLFPKESIETL